ncbi:MAG: SPOR domain-containing protein [Limnohabitans sp.]
MAFFKLRFPGRNASVEAVSSGSNQNIEVVRRRARYRLMGAVVLVLMAVVVFPLVFDTQPRPIAVGTPIVIPDRQTVAPLTAPVPAAQAPAKPWNLAPETLSTQAALDPREEVVPPSNAGGQVSAASEVKPKVEKPVETPHEKAVQPHAKEDASKALTSERLIIQVGAFSDPSKVREVRSKLEGVGLKTYTQVVDGKDGKPMTRVRLGPFDTRDEVEKVAARIRKLNLSPAILKI